MAYVILILVFLTGKYLMINPFLQGVFMIGSAFLFFLFLIGDIADLCRKSNNNR